MPKNQNGGAGQAPCELSLGKALIAKGFDRKKYGGGATLRSLLLKTGKFDLHPPEKPTRVKKK